MTEFQPTRDKQPPPGANGHASLCWSPADETLYLFAPSQRSPGIEIWAWTGNGWTQRADGIFEETFSGRPLAAFGRDDVYVFRAGDGEFHVLRLSTMEESRIAVPDLSVGDSHGFAAFNPDSGRFLVCSPTYQDSTTYAFDGSHFEPLARGPVLMSGCWDQQHGRLVGIDVRDQTHFLGAGGWQPMSYGFDRSGSDIAYDPNRQAVIRLMAESDDVMQLYAGRAGADTAEPLGLSMRPYMASAALGVDAARNQVCSFGGQDFRKQGDWSNQTWVSTGGDDFVEMNAGGDIDVGMYVTPVHMGDTLLAVDHSTLEVSRATENGWDTAIPSAARPRPDDGLGRFDYRYINFAASPVAVFMLDAAAAMWRAEPGGPWRQIIEPGSGPEARYSRRVAFNHDPVRNRLVVFGGLDNNDTWIHDGQSWRKLREEIRPACGIATMAATPGGLYLAAGRDIWLLEDDQWRCVGTDDSITPRGLLYDRRRNALFTFDSDYPNAHLYVWTAGGWEQVAMLPEGLAVRDTMSGMSAEAGLDAHAGVIHLLHEEMNYSLALDSLDLSGARLPDARVEPLDATREAPADAKERALEIEPLDDTVDLRSLDVPVVVPDGWSLVALLPLPADVARVEGATGLAVLMVDEYWETDHEPWRLGGGGIEVRLLHGDAPPLAVALPGATDGQMQRAEFREYYELEPDAVGRFHASDGDAPTNRTKLGGHPSYIQGEPRELADYPEMSFLGQLASDVFGASFGDMGSVYIFVAPDGSTASVMQSH